MSNVLMLSSLFGAVLTLGLTTYKTMQVVEATHCRTFPHECGEGIEAATKTITQPVAEATRQLMQESQRK